MVIPTPEPPVGLDNLPNLGQANVQAFIKGVVTRDHLVHVPLVRHNLQFTMCKLLILHVHTIDVLHVVLMFGHMM